MALLFEEKNKGEPLLAETITIIEKELIEASPPELPASELRKAWWCCFYLNLSVLWGYYTLLSAQNVYISLYPNDDITFLGIMLSGIAMVFGQLFTMIMQLDTNVGFDLRIQLAYLACVMMAVVVMVFQEVGTILAAWASTGIIDVLTEAKLYTLAAIGASNGELTNAVQLGNGFAGLLNVIACTIIRICVYAALGAFGNDDAAVLAQAQADSDRLSFYLFMALVIVMSLISIPVYRYLVNMPGFKQRLDIFRNSNEQATTQSFVKNLKDLRRVLGSIWGAVFIQFFCFFMSLSVFPGIPCSVSLVNSVFSPAWYCSQGIIPAFNGGDWLGKLLPMVPATQQIFRGAFRVNSLGVGRVVFVFLIMFCTIGNCDNASPALPWIVLFSIIAFAITNGVVSTLTLMRAPLLVEYKDRETAAQLMVLALYAGMAAGTILAAVLDKLGLV